MFLLNTLTHLSRYPVPVPIPDLVHHQNRGPVAVPALALPRLLLPQVHLPPLRVHPFGVDTNGIFMGSVCA